MSDSLLDIRIQYNRLQGPYKRRADSSSGDLLSTRHRGRFAFLAHFIVHAKGENRIKRLHQDIRGINAGILHLPDYVPCRYSSHYTNGLLHTDSNVAHIYHDSGFIFSIAYIIAFLFSIPYRYTFSQNILFSSIDQ